ncbi:MAG: hypothetical protein V1494_00840 [Candidatus Diapherotrites archaeon]
MGEKELEIDRQMQAELLKCVNNWLKLFKEPSQLKAVFSIENKSKEFIPITACKANLEITKKAMQKARLAVLRQENVIRVHHGQNRMNDSVICNEFEEIDFLKGRQRKKKLELDFYKLALGAREKRKPKPLQRRPHRLM